MKIIANEYIYPPDESSCHASSFDILPDGSIFAAWFRGSAEGACDVRIFGAKREGGRWSEPRPLTADDGIPHWNPVVDLSSGSLRVYYKIGETIAGWHTEVIESYDGGNTFSPSREMVPGDRSGGRGPVRNRILRLSDGSLLAPGSTEYDGWKCFADRSEDGGSTWTRSADITLPPEDLRPGVPAEEKRRGLIQPAFFEDPARPGRVIAFMRSTEGRVFRAESTDFGRSFGPAFATAVKNNNSGIDLDVSPDGRIFLVCNPVGVPEGKIWGKRTPLSVLVSEDGGDSFSRLTEIATGDGTFAYPSVRYREGRLHVTYTWNRKMICYFCAEV